MKKACLCQRNSLPLSTKSLIKLDEKEHRINAADPRIVRPFTNNCKLEQVSEYDNTGHVARRVRRGGTVRNNKNLRSDVTVYVYVNPL